MCMQRLSRHACCCSYLFTYFVTVPHSVLTQLAWPLSNAQQGDGSFQARPSACKDKLLEDTPSMRADAKVQHLVECGRSLSTMACLSGAGNVFGVVPNNPARDVSIILMVIHEVCLSLCCTRLAYMISTYKNHSGSQKGPFKG